MERHCRTPTLGMTVLAALLGLPACAAATCTRPIIAPVSAVGLSVIIKNDQISGIFPELIESIGLKAGCRFTWSAVPRIRLETMFEAGQADILVAATHSERRDKAGLFIPMVETRPTLISIDATRAPIITMAQLLERRELRVALVRGFDYGQAYLDMITKLSAQGRLYLESDPLRVARLLHGGMADVTIMPPSAIIGAIQGDARVDGMLERIRIEPLPELPWIRSGVYISNKTLGPADHATLKRALSASAKQGELWQAYKRYFPPAVLAESTRPL